jgi:hypothetical protein
MLSPSPFKITDLATPGASLRPADRAAPLKLRNTSGPLTDWDRRRLIAIADWCPVHRTLRSEITFETTTRE